MSKLFQDNYFIVALFGQLDGKYAYCLISLIKSSGLPFNSVCQSCIVTVIFASHSDLILYSPDTH